MTKDNIVNFDDERFLKGCKDTFGAENVMAVDAVDNEAAKEAKRQYQKQWRKNNPDKVRAANERYWKNRAAKAGQQLRNRAEVTEPRHNTVEYAPVIRCKNCIYWLTTHCAMPDQVKKIAKIAIKDGCASALENLLNQYCSHGEDGVNGPVAKGTLAMDAFLASLENTEDK